MGIRDLNILASHNPMSEVETEYQELIKNATLTDYQKVRVRHLKWHLDKGDIRCRCYEVK